MAIATEGLLGPALDEVLTNSSATIFTFAGAGALTVIEDPVDGARTIKAELTTAARQAIYTFPVATDVASIVFERKRPSAPTLTHEIFRLYSGTTRPLAIRENADGKVSVVINASTVAWTSTAVLGTADDAAYVRYTVAVDRVAQTWQLAFYAGSSTTAIETSPVFSAQTGLGAAAFTTMQFIQPATADAHTAYWRRFRIKSGTDYAGLDVAPWTVVAPEPEPEVPLGSAPWQNSLAGPVGTAVTKANTAPMGTDFDFVVTGAGSTATYVDLPWGDRGVRLSVSSATDSTYLSWYDPAATAERGVLVLPLWLDTVPSAAQVPVAQIRNVDQGIMGMLKLDADIRAGRLVMSESGGADVIALRGSTVLQALHLYWVGIFVDKGTNTTTGALGWILWDSDRETVLETLSATGRNTGITSPSEYRVGSAGPSTVVPRNHYLAEIQGGPMAAGWPNPMLTVDSGVIEAEPWSKVQHTVSGATEPVAAVESTVPAGVPIQLVWTGNATTVQYEAPARFGGVTVTLRFTDTATGAEALVTDTIASPTEYEYLAGVAGLQPLRTLDATGVPEDPENPPLDPEVPVMPTPTDLRLTEYATSRLRMEVWGGKTDPTFIPADVPTALRTDLLFIWREKGNVNPVGTTTVPWRETGVLSVNNPDGTPRTYEYTVQVQSGGVLSEVSEPETHVLASAQVTLATAGQVLAANYVTNNLVASTTVATLPSAADGLVGFPALAQGTGANRPSVLDEVGRKYMHFDGVSDRLTVSAVPLGNAVGGLSGHALIRVQPGITGNRCIYEFDTATTGSARFYMGLSTTGQLRASGRRLDADANSIVVGTRDLRDGLWHWVAVVLDYINARIRGYVDGALEFDLAWQTAGLSSPTDSARLVVGSMAGSSEYFSGDMMHPVIYNGAQTTAQVTAVGSILDDEFPVPGPAIGTTTNAPTTTSLSWTYALTPAAPLTHELFDANGNVVKSYTGASATTHTVNYTGLASATAYTWQARATGSTGITTTVTGSSSTTAVPTSGLKWPRLHPLLTNPLTDHVQAGWQKLVYPTPTSYYLEDDQGVKGVSGKMGNLALAPGSRTYVVPPPVAFKVRGGLTLFGGHDIQWVGGELNQTGNYPAADWNATSGVNLNASARKAMQINQFTGDQYVEGLWIHGEQVGDCFWSNQKLTTKTGMRYAIFQRVVFEDARALNLAQQAAADIGFGKGIDENGINWLDGLHDGFHQDVWQEIGNWTNTTFALSEAVGRSGLQGCMNNGTGGAAIWDLEKVLLDMTVPTGYGPVQEWDDLTEAERAVRMDVGYALYPGGAKPVIGPDVKIRTVAGQGAPYPSSNVGWRGQPITEVDASVPGSATPSWIAPVGIGYLATVTP